MSKESRKARKAAKKEEKAEKLIAKAEAKGDSAKAQKLRDRAEKKKGKAAKKLMTKTEKKTLRKSKRKDAGFSVLTPFKPFMLKALKKKGYTPANTDIKTVSIRFYEIFVQRKQNFEIEVGNVMDMEQETDGAGTKVAKGVSSVAAATVPGGAIISGIITAILDYIKNLKAKKAAGGTLSAEESIILDGAESVSNSVETYAADEAKFALGDMITEYWYVLAGAILLLIFLKRK